METDTEVQAETVTTPTPERQLEQTADTTAFTQEDVNRIVNERLERERAKQAKAQETATAEAARKALEDNQEFKALYEAEKERLVAIEDKYNKALLESTRRDIAAKVGIPAQLATRLQGETAEEIEADAVILLSSLPRPAPPSTNGGAGSYQKPTGKPLSSAELEMAKRMKVSPEAYQAAKNN